jgi:hypothetical protein
MITLGALWSSLSFLAEVLLWWALAEVILALLAGRPDCQPPRDSDR